MMRTLQQTPGLLVHVGTKNSDEMLLLFRDNVSTATILWNQAMRIELLSAAHTNIACMINHLAPGVDATTFEYEAMKDKIVIAGVFVDAYLDAVSLNPLDGLLFLPNQFCDALFHRIEVIVGSDANSVVLPAEIHGHCWGKCCEYAVFCDPSIVLNTALWLAGLRHCKCCRA